MGNTSKDVHKSISLKTEFKLSQKSIELLSLVKNM